MRSTLTAAGYEIDDAKTGEEALAKIREFHPDLVLLDINMPGMGGLATCRKSGLGRISRSLCLRFGTPNRTRLPHSMPARTISLRNRSAHRSLWREYVPALRRLPVSQSAPVRLRVGRLLIDFGARKVANGSKTAHLTPKELDVLRYLTQSPNQAVSHRELLQAVWGPDYGDQVDYLRATVKNLRKKVELSPDEPQYIMTEPWVGYRFNGLPESE